MFKNEHSKGHNPCCYNHTKKWNGVTTYKGEQVNYENVKDDLPSPVHTPCPLMILGREFEALMIFGREFEAISQPETKCGEI